jgi:cation diffusion facilitator family transporter
MHLAHPPSADTKPVIKKILTVILFLNIAVAIVKFFIGFKSGSLSIIGDAAHSSIDSVNNIVALVAIKLAAEPADANHPYGHNKFETLGALAIVAFLAITSFELIEKSIMRFLNPVELPHIDNLTLYLLSGTLLVNIFVWVYEKTAAKKYNSEILHADAAHTFSDILVTISILISVFFIAQGYFWLDPVLTLVIALIIMHSGWEIIQSAVPILVDEAWIMEEHVKDLILETDKVVSFHNFRSRKVHDTAFVEMSVRFDTDSLREAHSLSHKIEHKIIKKFGKAHITIHVENA